MAADAEQLCRRFDQLKAKRAILEGHCEEVAQFCTPRHMGFVGQKTPHDKRMQSIYDSTGVHSLELLAAGLHGLATNPASKWFALRLVDRSFDDDDEVKDWLSDTTDAMRAEMYAPGSGLTTALNEMYLELGAFGTSIMFIGSRDAGGLLFQTRPLAECFIAESHENEVDTVFRKTTMTARQVMQKWPDTASKDVREKIAANKSDDAIEIVHAVFPREDRNRRKRNRENMPFASVYFETKAKNILEEGGFPEFPFAAPRWSKLPAEEYGRSPAMTALPDVKQLQEMTKTLTMAGQLAVAPPMAVPDDGVVGPVRMTPYGLTFIRGQTMPQPLMGNSASALPFTLELIQDKQNQIRTTFFADVLQIVSDTDMTATEVVQRTTERMRLLGPIIGRLESELLGPMIARVFGILTRAKKIPPPPRQIAGMQSGLGIEFVSPIAMAQKQTEASALTQTLGVLLPMIEATQDPSVLKPFKKDKLAAWAWDIFGGDPDLMYTSDELAEMAEQEAQAQQAAMAVQTAEQGASAMNQGAGAIDKLASAQQKGADISQLMPAA